MIIKTCAILLLIPFWHMQGMVRNIPRLPLASITNKVAYTMQDQKLPGINVKKIASDPKLNEQAVLWQTPNAIHKETFALESDDLLVDFDDNYVITLGCNTGMLWRRNSHLQAMCKLDAQFKENHIKYVKQCEDIYAQSHKSFGFIYRLHSYSENLEFLATGLENQVTLWHPASKTLLNNFYFDDTVKAICVSKNGSSLAIQLINNTIEIFGISFK